MRAGLRFAILLCSLFAVIAAPSFAAEEAHPPAVGEQARPLTLPRIGGEAVELAPLLEEGPVVLVVLRGWPGYQCPICTRQVGDLLANAEKFAAAKATVLLVYPGPAEDLDAHAREFIKGMKFPANFRFLTDPGYLFTNAYGLRWDAPRETAYPSSFVFAQGGKATFVKVSKTHGGRTSAAELLEALK